MRISGVPIFGVPSGSKTNFCTPKTITWLAKENHLIVSRRYIFINGWVFHCDVSLPGGVFFGGRKIQAPFVVGDTSSFIVLFPASHVNFRGWFWVQFVFKSVEGDEKNSSSRNPFGNGKLRGNLLTANYQVLKWMEVL